MSGPIEPEPRSSTDAPVEVSVVVPMYNEAENVDPFLDALCAVLGGSAESFEVLVVDDGSTDTTREKLRAYAARDARVKPLELSRNFGKEGAMAAGLEESSGRSVAFMDADLQHPPETLVAMLTKWRAGADVVQGVKASRGKEPLLYRLMASGFNAIAGRSVGTDLAGASDLKLIDRQVANALLACPERNRFFRGLVAWVGFRVAEVPFDVAARHAGSTSWTTRGLIQFAMRNLLAFSSTPLRTVAGVGVFALGASGVLAAQTFYRYLAGSALDGFTTVILLQIILSGLILSSLGVIALYLAEIYDEVKSRPLFLVRRARDGDPSKISVKPQDSI